MFTMFFIDLTGDFRLFFGCACDDHIAVIHRTDLSVNRV